MNGADALISTLVANDVTACFANPGASEMRAFAISASNSKVIA